MLSIGIDEKRDLANPSIESLEEERPFNRHSIFEIVFDVIASCKPYNFFSFVNQFASAFLKSIKI